MKGSGMAPETPALIDEQQVVAVDDTVLVQDALAEDVLVEEVSIDGMCGVY